MAPKLLYELEPGREAAEGRPEVGPTYRCAYGKDGESRRPGINTCYDLFNASVEKFPDRPCLAYREVLDGRLSPYKSYTYKETSDLVAKAGSAFKALGLKAQERLGVIAGNSVEWMISLQACNRMNVVCVPLYDTFGESAVEYVMQHSGVKVVVAAGNKVATMAHILKNLASGQVVGLVYWGEAPAEAVESIKALGISVHSWPELLELGASEPSEPRLPQPEDISTIMYTSGTTGNPKGVVHTHHGIVSEVNGMAAFLDQVKVGLTQEDRYFSYLTLAHIYDRVAEEVFLSLGACIGYYSGDMKLMMKDVAEFKPTVFAGVPRVLERVYSGVMDKVKKAGKMSERVFNSALAYKAFWLKRGFSSKWAAPLADRAVFHTTKDALGGHCRVVLSGAAPLAQYAMEFLNAVMCCPVVQGYGLTETCAGSFLSFPDHPSHYGTVGVPVPGLDMRLEAVPELNYHPTGKAPQGEICVRGPMLFQGYYKQPEMTAESVDADGFFHTGDIGEITTEGALKVIDRKKNIFKLSQGEYVAVEKVEQHLGKSDMVEQVWVYGNSLKNNLVAVVVPRRRPLLEWAKAQGLEPNFEALCKEPAAAKFVVEELQSTGRAAKLKGFELPAAVYLEPVPFSVEADLMTPKMSLKRPQLLKHYKEQIDAMYSTLK